MNLIDGHVTKVLEKKKFTAPEDWAEPGKVFDIFVVEYWDDGGDNLVTELWFEEDEGNNVYPGYVFQH